MWNGLDNIYNIYTPKHIESIKRVQDIEREMLGVPQYVNTFSNLIDGSSP